MLSLVDNWNGMEPLIIRLLKYNVGGFFVATANDLLKKDNSFERLFSLIYSTGFRLTGNHQSATLLVKKALPKHNNNGKPEPAEAIKNLCRAFIEDTANSRQKFKPKACGSNTPARNNSRVQEALLSLEPGERTAVVLRDTLGFSYAEIAGVTLVGEKDVATRIASARYKLKKLLAEAAV